MWMTFLLAMAGLGVLAQVRLSIEYRLLRQKYVLLEELLVTWAFHWLDPPEQLQQQLLGVVARLRPDLVSKHQAKGPPMSMGMDFGLGQLFCRLMGRD